jgi:hypothetical protein
LVFSELPFQSVAAKKKEEEKRVFSPELDRAETSRIQHPSRARYQMYQCVVIFFVFCRNKDRRLHFERDSILTEKYFHTLPHDLKGAAFL